MDRRGRDEDGSIGVANVEMAKAWDEEGARWAEQAERYDAAVGRHTRRLLDAARVAASDRVLDIGCGCGETTREAARAAVSGSALGADLSAPMIRRARERARAERLTNVAFERADAQVYPFERGTFGLVISRFGAMFFADPVAAFQNIGRALRPGGRLALLTWQELQANAWLLAFREALAMERALPEPPVGAPGALGLADADYVRHILAEAGFVGVALDEIREPMSFGRDAEDAFAFARTMGPVKGLLDDLDADAAGRALDALRATLALHETREGVLIDSRAWLITARIR